MIQFEPGEETLEPEPDDSLQWKPALWAGFIPGMILLMVPNGSPWSSLTFFSPVIMGRMVQDPSLPTAFVWALQLGLSMVYGLMIARAVSFLAGGRAIIGGGAIGLVLYGINCAVVTVFFPAWTGSESPVILTHVAFGLISAGVYRGLLRRSAVAANVSAE